MMVLAIAGCDRAVPSRSTPPAPTTAALEITITPSPLRLLIVCPPGSAYCFASMDSTVTIRETGGVGGRLDSIGLVLQNVTENRPETSVSLDSGWVTRNAGTNRIEARGGLAIRPIVEGYPLLQGTRRPDFAIILTLQFTDDRGNVLRPTTTAPIT